MEVEGSELDVLGRLPGEKYTECGHDTGVERSLQTEIPTPENLRVALQTTQASVRWTRPAGVDRPSYLLDLFSEVDCLRTIRIVHTESAEFLLSDLQLDTEYTISVSTVLDSHGQSKPASMSFTNSVREGPDDVRIVLLGKTGVGKSATGNTILGREAFKAETSAVSVTGTCQRETAEVNGRQITVIDTPGLFDTELDNEEIQREITNCISLVLPGPHVFLLVIQVGRFTQEERQAVKFIQSTFGESSVKCTIVLFTRGDDLKNKPIEEFMGKSGSFLMNLVDQCGKRYHMLNNTETRDCKQVSALLEKIDSMVTENGGGYYTSRMFQQMERIVQQERERKMREREMKLMQEKEDMKKEKEDVQAKYEKMKQMMEQERQNADEEKRRREEECREREERLKTELKQKENQQEKMQTEMERKQEEWKREKQEERKKREEEETRRKKEEHIWNEHYERLKKEMEEVQQAKQKLQIEKQELEVKCKAEEERMAKAWQEREHNKEKKRPQERVRKELDRFKRKL